MTAVNTHAGKPLFGTLIALLQDGVPVLGVIDQPITKERWIGVKGQGTTLNGEHTFHLPCPASSHCKAFECLSNCKAWS